MLHLAVQVNVMLKAVPPNHQNTNGYNKTYHLAGGVVEGVGKNSYRQVYSCWRPCLSISGGEPVWTIWALRACGSFAVIMEEFLRIHVARSAALLLSHVDNRKGWFSAVKSLLAKLPSKRLRFLTFAFFWEAKVHAQNGNCGVHIMFFSNVLVAF